MTEQQPYEVLVSHEEFELRRYPEHVVAEVTVVGSFEGVGNKAFMSLAGYINGRNHAGDKVAMTAPVIQRRGEQLIELEELQQVEVGPGEYVVSFVMPGEHTEASLSQPADERVRLRTVPEEHAAAVRYSGRWSRSAYQKRATELLRALADAGIEVTGPLRFARYDPPWTPWFLRRNEVVVPVARP
jgi:hypothetical protein